MSDRIFRWNNFEYELLMCLFKFKEAFNFDDMLNANESILCIAHLFLTEEKDTFDVALMQHKADSFLYKKRLLQRCIPYFKSDWINNMDHMRISGIESSASGGSRISEKGGGALFFFFFFFCFSIGKGGG